MSKHIQNNRSIGMYIDAVSYVGTTSGKSSALVYQHHSSLTSRGKKEAFSGAVQKGAQVQG